MNVKELALTLYELSMLISPEDPEKLLVEFGKTVLKRFNFSCFSAEVPALNLRVRIPERGGFRHTLRFSGKVLKMQFCRDDRIPPEYERVLEPLFEKMDYTLEYIILSKEREDLLKKSPDVIFLVDREGRVVEMNDAAKRVFGDLTGKELDKNCYEDICEHGGRYFSITHYQLGELEAVIGRDITDKIRLMNELREKEEKFRTLTEVSPVAVLVHIGGKIVFANDAVYRITGYTQEELIGASVWKLIHPDYHELAKEMLRKRLEGDRPTYEVKILTKNGEARWALVTGTAMKWEGKTGILVTGLDITERKELEAKLKESEELFRNLFLSSPAGQYILVGGKFKLVNPSFEAITGYSAEELRSKYSLDLVHPEDRSLVRERAIRMLKERSNHPYIYRLIRKDGEIRWVYEIVVPIKYGGREAVLGFIVDITDLEKERERLEEVTGMLELINRTLRHDVLNALTSSQMYLELASGGEVELIEKALTSINRAASIVKNMRAFESAVKRGELKCVDVREIAEEVAKSFDNVNVRGEGRALADEGLTSVIENIVQNAFLHSGTDRVDITIAESKDRCEVRIADYGKGIPDEIKERIFEEGFKHGETAQTGLGLYIVSKIVKRYGGEVWAEDNKPKGSVFVVSLRRC